VTPPVLESTSEPPRDHRGEETLSEIFFVHKPKKNGQNVIARFQDCATARIPRFIIRALCSLERTLLLT
jgi:hypothetical protein